MSKFLKATEDKIVKKDLRRITIHFNTQEEDGASFDNVDVCEFINEISTGYHDRFYEFRESEGTLGTLVNLDNVTCIVIGPPNEQVTKKSADNVPVDIPDLLISKLFPGDINHLDESRLQQMAQEAFDSLSERQKQFIERRFGFFRKKPDTLRKVADHFNVGTTCAFNIINKALKQMVVFIRNFQG